MAGIINYQFDPNQAVHVIVSSADKKTLAVKSGTVIRVRAVVLVSETTVEYDVRLIDQYGTTSMKETDIFPDLATAVDEYEVRLS